VIQICRIFNPSPRSRDLRYPLCTCRTRLGRLDRLRIRREHDPSPTRRSAHRQRASMAQGVFRRSSAARILTFASFCSSVRIAENFAHRHPNHQLRLCIFLQQRIVIIDARNALKPEPVWLFEIDEQHADLGVPEQVTHRIEHAVAVVARKCDGLTVENANEPRIAAL
jgi:hypothetical protein